MISSKRSLISICYLCAIASGFFFFHAPSPLRAAQTSATIVGATVPFVTLEAEDGDLAGGATIRRFEYGSPVPDVATLELEASGGALAQLADKGASVSWRNPVAGANSIVIRSSLPDAPEGGGITATLNLYVDGQFRQAVTLSSQQSWVYRNNGWFNDPKGGGMPFKFYNEDRALITGKPLAAGSTITLRKDEANTSPLYDLDCVDLENVAPALAQPAGSISIVDYGADATGATDSQAAIARAVDEARKRGVVLWIPAGRFLISSVIPTGLDLTGVTVRGAGMWHSMLYRRVPLSLPEPPKSWRSYVKVGTATKLSDISIDSNAPRRAIGQLGGSDYGILAVGSDWLVERVWVSHCDAQWMSGSNGTIRDCRVADSWGDGINLNNGNTPNPEKLGFNLTAQNNFVRGAGDDGLATYSDSGDKGDNGQMVGTRLLNNTSIAPYWANCLRVAGGRDVVVRNNLLMDAAANNNLEVGIFGKSGNPLESALIENNVMVRGGGWNGKNRYGLFVYAKSDTNSNLIFRNNTIQDSRRAGVVFAPDSYDLTFENNRIIHPTTDGIVIEKGVNGTAIFSGNVVSGLTEGQSSFKSESAKTLEATWKGNQPSNSGGNQGQGR